MIGLAAVNPKMASYSGGIDSADINKARALLLKVAHRLGFVDITFHVSEDSQNLGINTHEDTITAYLNQIRGVAVTDTALIDALLSCGEAKNGSEAGLILRELMNFGFIRRKLTYNNSDAIGFGLSDGHVRL